MILKILFALSFLSSGMFLILLYTYYIALKSFSSFTCALWYINISWKYFFSLQKNNIDQFMISAIDSKKVESRKDCFQSGSCRDSFQITGERMSDEFACLQFCQAGEIIFVTLFNFFPCFSLLNSYRVTFRIVKTRSNVQGKQKKVFIL